MRFEWLNDLKKESIFHDSELDKSFIGSAIINYLVIVVLFCGATIAVIPIILSAITDHIITLYYYLKTYKEKKHKVLAIKARMLEYEQELLKEDLLHLEFDPNISKNHWYNEHYYLSSFIYTFIKRDRLLCNTLDNNNNIICIIGKRRSLGDIYRICKYYYPNCTLEQILELLIKGCKDKHFSCQRCNQINKYVFHKDSDYIDFNGQTEYGYYKDYKGYTKPIYFKDLIEIYGS